MKETRNDNQVAGSTSSKSKVAQVGASCNALFPSNCTSGRNLEKLVLIDSTREQGSEELVVNVVFDLEGHDSAFFSIANIRRAAAASTEDNIHEEGKETGNADKSSNLKCYPQSRRSLCRKVQFIGSDIFGSGNPSTQALDKLRQLNLWRLPMLSHIWEKGL
ncbi:NB-ARC domain-containing disease resistance protein, partial [Prunus dulcis]